MKDLRKFHKHLIKESGTPEYSIDEAVDKDLAKEDALSLVSEFVKDVKKKFPNKEDKLEILRDVSKTLEFYINEIENTSSIDIMSSPMAPPALSFDDLVGSDDEESSSIDSGEEGEE